MGTSTTVYFGTYLICHMSNRLVNTDGRKCSKAGFQHGVPHGTNFCPVCGAPAKIVKEREHISMRDVVNGEVFAQSTSRDDMKWLMQFTVISAGWVGKPSNIEIVLLNETIGVSADEEGLRPMPRDYISAVATEPDVRMLTLLKRLIGYKKIDVKCGGVVAIA